MLGSCVSVGTISKLEPLGPSVDGLQTVRVSVTLFLRQLRLHRHRPKLTPPPNQKLQLTALRAAAEFDVRRTWAWLGLGQRTGVSGEVWK
jgi:hypothetical protein